MYSHSATPSPHFTPVPQPPTPMGLHHDGGGVNHEGFFAGGTPPGVGAAGGPSCVPLAPHVMAERVKSEIISLEWTTATETRAHTRHWELLAQLQRATLTHQRNLATYMLGEAEIAPAGVLMLGSGDLAFADGLREKNLLPPELVVTTFPSLDKLTNSYGGRFKTRLHMLKTRGVMVRHGVDATRLGADEWLAAKLKLFSLVVWNFPYSDDIDGRPEVELEPELHRVLMENFFMSLAALCLRTGARPLLALSLCNDQATRWQIFRSARTCFFHLCGISTFTAQDTLPRYRPTRNHTEEPFPFSNPFTYTFAFHPPRSSSSSFSDTSLGPRLGQQQQ